MGIFNCCNDNELLINKQPNLSGSELCNTNIEADVILEEARICVLEGVVRFQNGDIASNVQLKLFRCVNNCLELAATTTSDNCGNYRFEVLGVNPNDQFFIAVVTNDESNIENFRVVLRNNNLCRCQCRCNCRRWCF